MSCVASEGRRWRIASQLTRFDSKGDGGAWGDGGERKASRSGGVERLSVVSVILPSHENERHLGRALGAGPLFTDFVIKQIPTRQAKIGISTDVEIQCWVLQDR